MAKVATQWKPLDSGTATNEQSGFDYLMESGDLYLTEDGFFYELEGSVVSTKTPEVWSIPTKGSTSWRAEDGFTTYTGSAGVTNITEAGDTRITETGDTRVYEDSTASPKLPVTWTVN